MNKETLILSVLAASEGEPYSPVQIQKVLFLVDRNIPELVGGQKFDFQPYDYGPFDKSVYRELELLAENGLVEIVNDPNFSYRRYHPTRHGLELGKSELAQMPEKASRYIKTLSDFVRHLSFSELVSVIYEAYPEMDTNSVFRKQ